MTDTEPPLPVPDPFALKDNGELPVILRLSARTDIFPPSKSPPAASADKAPPGIAMRPCGAESMRVPPAPAPTETERLDSDEITMHLLPCAPNGTPPPCPPARTPP